MKHSQKNQSLTAELELTMTRSSMGFEYALKKLHGQDQFSLDVERVNAQLDDLQHIYFEAREKFLRIDSTRLQEFELQLSQQKIDLFTNHSSALH